MISVTVKDLQNISINKLIDENVRFTIVESNDEEANVEDVVSKIALLREGRIRES